MPSELDLSARDKHLALKLLAESDGGKVITDALLADISSTIERLSSEYRTGSHFDLVRLCADLNSRLSLYRALTRAEKKLKAINEIIADAITNE